VSVDDYVETPRSTGYRAIHVVTFVENLRRVEIQLRTPGQNVWADTVEKWSDRLGYDLKNGDGPRELVHYFEMAAYRIACEERGETVEPDFGRRFDAARAEVRHYFD
jgi:ppGpp synthetase/RelA/SpoT-type nucleotidyltranferase